MLTTDHGSVSFDFPIEIPQLRSDGFEFDYAPVGTLLNIIGDNFDLYGFTKDGTTVTFTGGATAQFNGGHGHFSEIDDPNRRTTRRRHRERCSTIEFHLHYYCMVYGYKGALCSAWILSQAWNGAAFIANGPDPAPFAGQKYFRIAKTFGGGWAWDPFMSNRVPVPADLVNNQNNFNKYTLKFEVFAAANSAGIPSPINIVFQDPGYKETWFDPSGKRTISISPPTGNG